MRVVDRVLGRLGYVPRPAAGVARGGRPHSQREFAAAQIGRLVEGWTTEHRSFNAALYSDLRKVRSRARQLAVNNDYVRHFLRMCVTNVVGPNGMTLDVQAKKPDGSIDKADSDYLETQFGLFSRKGAFDVTGRLSRRALEAVWIRQVARDGEILVRKIKGRGPYGMQLQLIDPAALDERLNKDLGNGRKIVMGVELDEWRKPVAYHLTRADQGDIYPSWSATDYVRVPADEIWHSFIQEDAMQVRGVPWVISAMLRVFMLGGFEEAAVIAARVGASKMGFFESETGDALPLADGTTSDVAGNETFAMDAEAGTFQTLPAGYSFKDWDPDYPHQHYASFTKSVLRGISAGFGVSYHNLTSDLEGINLSSIRGGMIEEREHWKTIQSWMIEELNGPLYSEWLPVSILSGALNLPFSKLAKFDSATFTGRRWPWPDPLKDVQAKLALLGEAMTSRTDIMREMGVSDPERVWATLDKEAPRVAPHLKEGAAGATSAQPKKPGNNEGAADEDDDDPDA